MNGDESGARPQSERNTPDWIMVSIGVMTIATIIAAATAAAAINISRESSDGDSTLTTGLALGIAGGA